MYLGIDLGTSAVKVMLVDALQQVIARGGNALTVQRPQPLWSEQDPQAWWAATDRALRELKAQCPRELSAVRAIGLSGQMHGAVLLGTGDRVLRPAILWNDGRSFAECSELERRAPTSRRITGNLAMPGFTAPKLLWVQRNEPALFSALQRVLLPKDYLRLRMCGTYASDVSDAAGTLWLDVAARGWSEEMLAACNLRPRQMPSLLESCEPSAELLPEVAAAWGLGQHVLVAAGSSDNAAGAIGVGVARSGEALLSLGTSGVYFVASDRYSEHAESALHTFCHALPSTWHHMAVILSAASCLRWLAGVTGARDEAELLAELEPRRKASPVLFLPYLSGERTPHNDPLAKGVFFGMSHDTSRGDLTRAVLEGVAFAFADGQRALAAGGIEIDELSVIGGGAQSALWGEILASALDRPLTVRHAAEVGPAFGAARLARLAHTRESPRAVVTAPAIERVLTPHPALVASYDQQAAKFRQLYLTLKPAFSA